ncbi:LamG domain-containing protein, partial [Patescibacteria group bacterium]|nr:LamG domain-containing protein [Patescibacteria group bacterium]
NAEHTVELELLAKKNPRQSDSVDGSNFLFDLDYFETRASQFELSGASIASTADTGTPTTLFDSALTQPDDFWNGAALTFTSGDNNGETVFVTDFDGDNGKLTFSPAVDTAVSEETFQLTPDGILIGERATRGIASLPSVARNDIGFETLGNLPTTADGKTKKGSFSIWVSPDFDSDADTDKHFIFDSGLQRLYYDGVGDKFHFEIWNPSTSSGQAADWETVDVESASQDFSAYEDFHLAAGWDADSGVKLFVNGIKTAKSTLWMAQPLSAGDKQFTVGKCGKKSAGNIDENLTYFSGTLAEPQIWNYVLLDSEIYEIYNSAIPSIGQAHTQKVESINSKVQSLLFNAPLVGTPNDRAGTLAGSAKLDSTTVGEVATISAMDGRESNWIENERVGFWKFDPAFAGQVPLFQDSSGNENTGIWNDADESGQSFPTGQFNSAAEFDGTDDYIDVGLTGQTAKAVSCWIFADDDSGGIIDFDGGVHSIETAAGAVVATGFDTPTIYVDGSVGSKITAGAWHHISITTATGVAVSVLEIGRVGETFFDGKIDDFAIYSRELAAEEVAKIYVAQSEDYVTFETSDDTTEVIAGFDTGPDRGIARVTIDENTPQEITTEIDTYSSTISVNQRFLVATGLDAKRHTVKIKSADVANLNSSGGIIVPQFIESGSQPTVGSSQMIVNGRLADDVMNQDFTDFPNAVQFPGKGNISELQHTGTLEMWVTGALAAGDHFLDTRDSSGNNGLRIYMDSADSLVFEFQNADSAISIADADFSDSFDSESSNHILAKWQYSGDSEMGMSLYLNGRKVAENISQIFTPTSHSGIVLGNDSTPDAVSDFDGLIYDFAIYSHSMEDGGVAVNSFAAPNSEIWKAWKSVATETQRIASLQIDSDTTVNAADDSTTTFFLERGGLRPKVFTAESYEINNRNAGLGLRIGDSENTGLAQEFQIGATGAIPAVSLRLKKVGTPSGDIFIEIQTDAAGLPSGTSVANGISNSMAVDEIAANDYEWATFTFAAPPILRTDTIFHLVLKGNYTASAEDYISWGADSDSPEYSNGTSEIKNNEWADSVEDFIFRIHENYPLAASVNAYVNGLEVSIDSVKAGTYARLNDSDGITQISSQFAVGSIQNKNEIPAAGFLFLGNPTGNLKREKVYYSSYSSNVFSGLKRGIDGTVPGNWTDGTIVEIAGTLTLASAPTDGSDLFVKYNYSGDAIDRSRGTYNIEHGTISFLDTAMKASDGWSENDSDLAGYWKFDPAFAGQAPLFQDSSGNENTGIWNDADESGQSFPTGQFNNAAEFDGA